MLAPNFFPLRLTPFEEYMLLDSRPVYPMSCFIVLNLEGELRITPFENALQKTLEKHPLLNCSVKETAKNRFFWQPNRRKIEILRSGRDACRKLPRTKGIDLFREPALKITLCNEKPDSAEVFSGKTEVVFETHHSACDGSGMSRFIEDLLYEYAFPNQSPKRQPVETERLRHRNQFGLSFLETIRNLPKQCGGFRRAWLFFAHKIMPLTAEIPKTNGNEPAEDFPAVVSCELSEEQTQNVRRNTKQQGITLNDMLLCGTFDAVKSLQEAKSIAEKGFIRIAVPTNLRTPEDASLPAANKVSMVFIDRKRKDIQQTGRFYRLVHQEMQHIKHCRLGWAFIHGLTVYKWLFGSIRNMVRRECCWATATVSNLGILFDTAELPVQHGRIKLDDTLEMTGAETVPPIRCGTSLGICAFTCMNKLKICIHYDAGVLIKDDAEAVLRRLYRLLTENNGNSP